MQSAVGQGWQRVLRSKFLTDLGWYGSSTILMLAVRFGMSLLVARHVGPDAWGIWAIFSLVIAYFPNVHLGSLNAMNREVPILKGAGSLEQVKKVRANVLSFMLVGSLLGGIGVCGYALAWAKPSLSSGLLLIVPLLILNQFWIWVQFALKSDNRFVQLGQQQMVFTLASLACLPLAFGFGLEGFVLAQVIATATTLIWAYFTRSFEMVWRLEWPEVFRLMKIGVPILIVGLLFTLLTTLDRWLIAGHLGLKSLGLYAFAMTLTMVVQIAPGMVADQVYTRMLEAWGATRNVGVVRSWMWRQILISLAAVFVTGLVSILILPILIRAFFQDYIPSLEPFRVLVLYPVGLALSAGPANLLNTLGFQYQYLLVQALALPVLWLLGSLMLTWGLGMLGVAWALVLTFVVYGAALILLALLMTRRLEVQHGT
jgi:O-antigen/teichoic acid export membrane protein